MKPALTISLLLNLSLLGALMLASRQVPRDGASSLLPATPQVKMATPLVAAVPPDPVPLDRREPFHWSQLESTDYHVYVQNLRAAGCPEPTVRAIVTADVNRHYDAQYQQLAGELTALATNSWFMQLASNSVEQSLREQLQQLPGEEDAEIADLLGWKPAPAVEVAAPASPASTAQVPRPQAQPTDIVMPLIFQNVDPQNLNLSPDQIQAIANLRQEFWDQIGGPNQDPNDPAYRERWEKAQPEMDSMLRGMIGTTAFQRYQMNAMRPILANSSGQ